MLRARTYNPIKLSLRRSFASASTITGAHVGLRTRRFWNALVEIPCRRWRHASCWESVVEYSFLHSSTFNVKTTSAVRRGVARARKGKEKTRRGCGFTRALNGTSLYDCIPTFTILIRHYFWRINILMNHTCPASLYFDLPKCFDHSLSKVSRMKIPWPFFRPLLSRNINKFAVSFVFYSFLGNW